MKTDEIDPRIKYHSMTSPAPSEAWGTFDGFSFYFYARWDYCTFTISRTPDIDAICIFDMAHCDFQRTQSPDDPAPAFPDDLISAYQECFHVEREFPKGKYKGSYLDDDEKMSMIREFCALFDSMNRSEYTELLSDFGV